MTTRPELPTPTRRRSLRPIAGRAARLIALLALCLSLLGMAAQPAQASEATLTGPQAPAYAVANLEASADTYMNDNNNRDDYNYGGSQTIEVNTNSTYGNDYRGALLKWDLSSIPSNATITSASITFYVTTASNRVFDLYSLRRDWVEGTRNGDGTGTGASWLYYGAGSGYWTQGGARSSTGDRYDTSLWTLPGMSFSTTGNVEVTLNSAGVAVVQNWVNGTTPNYGVTMQRYDSSANDVLIYASSEHSTRSGPILNVTYTLPVPTITVSGALTAFSSPAGVPSANQTYTVSGTNLTAPIVVTPPADFQISLTGSGGWVSSPGSLSLTPTGGTLPAATIYVRFNRAAIGTSSGNITHTATGAAAQNQAVSGTAVNAAPVLAAIGSQAVDELALLSFTATAADANPGDTLAFSLVGAPEGAAITTGGDFTWTPTEAQGPGAFSFDVCVSDGALSDCETITVDVAEVNLAPAVAAIDDGTVDELAPLTFTAAAGDPDQPANTLVFSLVGAPEGAAIDPATGAFTWTPTEAQGPGVYPFSVRACDNASAPLCGDEHVTITVSEVNAAPQLAPIGGKSVDELALLSFTAAAGDPDQPANTLAFSLVGAPEGAAITTDGEFTWTPTEAQGPGAFSFDVCVSDGALSDCETITVDVAEVNLAPTLAAIGAQSVDELAPLSFQAAATDGDLPANTLSFTLEGRPTGATFNTATGEFSWTPGETQGPGAYPMTVCAGDGVLSDCETFTITVGEVNSAPALNAIGPKTVDELAVLAFTAAAGDGDQPANTLTFSLAGAPAAAGIDPASGAFTWTPTEAQGPGTFNFDVCVSDGALNDCETIAVEVAEVNTAPSLPAVDDMSVDELAPVAFSAAATDADLPANTLAYRLEGAPEGAGIDAAGAFTWTPTETQGPGVYPITIHACDNAPAPLCADEAVTITVAEVNSAPALTAIGPKSVDELAVLAFTAAAVDGDLPASALAFSLAGAPDGATLDPTGGAFTWTPTEVQGPASFSFDVCVSDGALNDCETINVTVAEVNAAPAAGIDSYGTPMNTALTAPAPGVMGNDHDADLPANPLTAELVTDVPAGQGTLAFNADGSFTYTPPVAWLGSTGFTYRIFDGQAYSEAAAVSINVYDTNRPPTDITLSNADVPENSPAGVTVGTLATVDPDSGDIFSYTLAAGEGDTDNAFFTLDGATLKTNAVFNFEVKQDYTIRVRSTDQGGQPVEKSFAIHVTNINEAPTAAGQSRATTEDTLLAITLTGADPDGDALTFQIVTQPTHGVLSGTAPNLTYTPNANANGADSFTFRTDDGRLTSADATVTINLSAVNDAPVNTVPAAQTLAEDASLTFNSQRAISVADVDVAETLNGKLQVRLSVAHGRLTLSQVTGLTFVSGDGAGDTLMIFQGTAADINAALLGLVYTPDADYNGSETLTIVLSDLGNSGSGGTLTDSDTVSISITPVDEDPFKFKLQLPITIK